MNFFDRLIDRFSNVVFFAGFTILIAFLVTVMGCAVKLTQENIQ